MQLTVSRSAACLLDNPEATSRATTSSDGVSWPVLEGRLTRRPRRSSCWPARSEVGPGADPFQDAPRFGCLAGRFVAPAEPGEDGAVGGLEARGLEGLEEPCRYRCRIVEGAERQAGVMAVSLEQATDTGGVTSAESRPSLRA